MSANTFIAIGLRKKIYRVVEKQGASLWSPTPAQAETISLLNPCFCIADRMLPMPLLISKVGSIPIGPRTMTTPFALA